MSAHDSRPGGGRPLTDEEMLQVHEHALVEKVDDGGNYKLLPLMLLFFFSGLIFFGGSYLNFFSGHFSPLIFDERALPTGGALAAVKVDPAVIGKVYYTSYCIQCHQADGKGQPGITPPLANSEWVNGREEVVIRILLNGLKDPVTVAGTTYPGALVVMPSIGQVPGSQSNWSDEKLAAVLTYIRQDFGNASPAVTPEKVSEIHKAIGTRATAWTESELKALR